MVSYVHTNKGKKGTGLMKKFYKKKKAEEYAKKMKKKKGTKVVRVSHYK